MKAGLLYLEIKQNQINDFKKVWNEFSVNVRKEPGIQALFAFVNPNTGKGLSVGLYNTLENAKALQSSHVYQTFLSSIRPFIKAEPHREICDSMGDVDSILSGLSGKKAA